VFVDRRLGVVGAGGGATPAHPGGTRYGGHCREGARHRGTPTDPERPDSKNDPGILPSNLLSVYRRPLPSANVAFLRRGRAPQMLDIMWDARQEDLRTQFISATLFHGQTTEVPNAGLITQGAQFQAGMFTGQVFDRVARDLTGDGWQWRTGGPKNFWDWRQIQAEDPLCANATGSLGELLCEGIKRKHFVPECVNIGSELFDAFTAPVGHPPKQQAKRESIARGEALFDSRVFTINFVAGLSDIKGDAAGTEPRRCSTLCGTRGRRT